MKSTAEIPIDILEILQHHRKPAKFISNFKAKANYFNRSFNQQCAAISTNGFIRSSFNLATNKTITTKKFDEQLISKLIVDVNPDTGDGQHELLI